LQKQITRLQTRKTGTVDQFEKEISELEHTAEREIKQLQKQLTKHIENIGGDPALKKQITQSAKQATKKLTKMLSEKIDMDQIREEAEEEKDTDSFVSDADREVAQLDQQWNDLVDEFVADRELVEFPSNTDHDDSFMTDMDDSKLTSKKHSRQ